MVHTTNLSTALIRDDRTAVVTLCGEADLASLDQMREILADARTLPEITTATRELREWVRQNPEDVGIREAFEGLSLMRDIAEEQEAERGQSNQSPVAAGQAA